MRIQYLTILLSCLFWIPAFAQKQEKCSEEEFRAKKQAYLKEKAGLTTEEAQAFFPLYFELQNKKKLTNKEIWKKAGKGMKSETKENEYKEIIDSFLVSQQIILDLEKEYIEKYRKVLSDKKIYMIYRAEIKFNRNMLKILQGVNNNKKRGL